MGDLKPCPFCGSENVSVEIIKPFWLINRYKNKVAAAGCHNCGASTQLYAASCSGFLNLKMTGDIKEVAKERARQAWNRRVKDDS